MLYQRRRSAQMPLLRERVAQNAHRRAVNTVKTVLETGEQEAEGLRGKITQDPPILSRAEAEDEAGVLLGRSIRNTAGSLGGGVVELEMGVVTVHPRKPLETVINDLEKLLHLVTRHGESLIELILVV